MAHAINQPVGIIRAVTSGALNNIRDNLFQPEEIEPLLNRILAQTERLHTIIDNFRQFARDDLTHCEEININHVVERTVAIVNEQFKHHNVTLDVQLCQEQPLPIVWANYFALQEVLFILLNNAREAIEGQSNATVWIKTWSHQNEIGFQVEDNGSGISQKYHEQIFIPFFTTKPTMQGTGLGLYMARKLVENLKGQIHHHKSVKGSACFIVKLPCVDRIK